MKNLLIIGALLLSMNSVLAGCSSAIKLGIVPTTPWLGATLENGLIAPAVNENQKILIQAAFIANAKICYEEVSDRMVFGLSIKH